MATSKTRRPFRISAPADIGSMLFSDKPRRHKSDCCGRRTAERGGQAGQRNRIGKVGGFALRALALRDGQQVARAHRVVAVDAVQSVRDVVDELAHGLQDFVDARLVAVHRVPPLTGSARAGSSAFRIR